MDDLFDILDEKKEEQKTMQQEPLETKASEVAPVTTEDASSATPTDKGNLKRTAVTAALLFLVPFCAALIFAFIAKQISPAHIQRKEGIIRKQEAEATKPEIPGVDADVAELMEYRNTLRKRGDSIDSANIRLWAAAGREPTLLFKILPPGIGEWDWSVSQCGQYALAIERTPPETLIKNVALYDFKEERWTWQNRLPWPEKYEDPWIFNGHLILRSIKNNRRFAMELDDTGSIISLDSLKGGNFSRDIPDIPVGITGNAVAERSNVIFVSDEEDNTLKGYTDRTLPGLKSIGPLPNNTDITGNGLLKFTALEGKIIVRDVFTGKLLSAYSAWNHSTNTTVQGIECNRDGSSVQVYLKSSYNFDKIIERKWSLNWKPADNILSANMTNPPSFTPRAIETDVTSADLGISISLHGSNMLEIKENTNNVPTVTIDLSLYIPCGDASIQGISLLEDGRFLLIKQEKEAYLLDLFSVMHYGDLLHKIEQGNKILAQYSDEELSRTNITDNAMRELKGADRKSDDADNFNYEMNEYQEYYVSPTKLEPPAKPSILSIQAEFFAAHHAWLYAANKLEQLISIQEKDHRAPKANPLLFARYSLLCGDTKRAKKACDRGLRSIFYDDSPYNRMIHWEMLKILFEQ